jgi:hypothetical protein
VLVHGIPHLCPLDLYSRLVVAEVGLRSPGYPPTLELELELKLMTSSPSGRLHCTIYTTAPGFSRSSCMYAWITWHNGGCIGRGRAPWVIVANGNGSSGHCPGARHETSPCVKVKKLQQWPFQGRWWQRQEGVWPPIASAAPLRVSQRSRPLASLTQH